MRSPILPLLTTAMLVLGSTALSGCNALSGISSLPGVSSVVPAPSIDGDWLVVRPGFSTFSLSLYEKGGKITGSAGTEPYTNPLAGTRTGNKVEFVITFKDSTTVTYSGDLSSDGSQITGVIGSGSSAADTFTANKKSSSR
ncbi:hypothetical protein J7643_03920 [bacterium]|nr:hypothetical protein [bacterium]